MHLTISRSVLTRELALLAAVAERKTTIPVLSCVRMDADGDSVRLTAIDLQNGLVVSIPATVTTPGSACIPAKRLADYVRQLPGDDVSIKVAENHYATVVSGKSRARIAGMSPESFPELPAAPEPVSEMDARLFARHLARVALAISQEESRFTLNAALVEIDGAVVRCVATDGHRLAWTEAEAASGSPAKFLMPKAAIGHFAKLADGAEGGARVAISSDDNHLWFAVGSRLLMARKVTGNFPDYKRVLPSIETHVVVERDALIHALERGAQFADERSRAMRFKFADGEIGLSASSTEFGESEESVSCEGALSAEIGFNAQYILDGLKAMSHERVAWFVKDAKSAGELRPMAGAGTEKDPYYVATDSRYVAMPMRI